MARDVEMSYLVARDVWYYSKANISSYPFSLITHNTRCLTFSSSLLSLRLLSILPLLLRPQIPPGAAFEGSRVNLCCRVLNIHRRQRRAVFEGTIPNTRHRVRNIHRRQRRAAGEGILLNTRRRVRNIQRRQRRAAHEDTNPNTRHRVRNIHRRQRRAVFEGT